MCDQTHDLNEVVATQVTEDGVDIRTRGQLLCARVREDIRHLIKHCDPEGYQLYRGIKYPQGDKSDTDVTRVEATKFLFNRVRDLLVPHYVPTKVLCGHGADEEECDDLSDPEETEV
jgi:hypothetical protein